MTGLVFEPWYSH